MRQLTVDEIERIILSRKDEQYAKILREKLGTRLQIAGLNREQHIAVLRELESRLPDLDEEFSWLNLLQDLWESKWFESRLLGLEMLFALPDLVDSHLWGMLDHWTNDIDNWALADWLGHVRAIALKKSPRLIMRMAPWLQSVDPWRRRSALVSLVYLEPGSLRPQILLQPLEVFAFVEPVIEDNHPAVQIALGWFLRIVGKENQQLLADFLDTHKNKLSRIVVEGATGRPASPTVAEAF